jgi:hypothetical protein
MMDPNQGVRGKGLSRLQDEGVEISHFPPEQLHQISSINTAFVRTQQTLGAQIISPENGDVLETFKTGGKHPVRFRCLNPPTESTDLFAVRNGLWAPQPHNFRQVEERVWEVDAFFGSYGNHALYIVTSNDLGRAFVRYYWKVGGINQERKDALSAKLSEADRKILQHVYSPIPMTGLPKGLLAEHFVTVEIAEPPK